MAMRPGWPSYIVVCFLCIAVPLTAVLLPRITFRKGDPRRRVTSFQEEGVLHFDTFLPSTDGETIYVGARDTLLALSTGKAGSLELKSKILWKPTPSATEDCAFKKNGNETCFNFIRVLLQLNETHLYTCGTYAFSPFCAYVDLQVFSMAKNKTGFPILEEGRGVIPFDPQLQSTAVLVDGELYVGTTSDFLGRQPIITRTLGSRIRLKTEPVSTWLYSDATFVASFNIPPDNEKVYFFFSETDDEVNYFGRLTVSRVARVCKNDVGGAKVLQRKWTTFLKAQLSCAQQGKFLFTVIQHVSVLLQPEGGGAIFYGVFASTWQTGNPGSSAVCAFNLNSIKNAFEGKYKEFNNVCSKWVTYSGPALSPRPGSCLVNSTADKILEFSKRHQLMDGMILPNHRQPLLVKEDVKYTRIAVHQAGSIGGTTYSVLFLGTDRGALHKVVVVGSGAHIIEAIQLFAEEEPVRNLFLSPEKAILYVGYSQGVVQVPLANCSLYVNCASCVLARDPYCAWDHDAHQCKNTHNAKENVDGWLQDVETGNATAKCPLVSGRTLDSSNASDGSLVTTLTPVLDSLVRLTCPHFSSLANYTWTYPSDKIPAGLIMELGHDLVVVVQKATLGTYKCQARENGYLQTMASYRLLSPSVPHFRTKLRPATEEQPRSEDKQQRSYWTQFVTVTVLLSMTLTAVVAVAAFSYRSRLRGKSKVQGCGTPEASKASRQERIPLNSSLFPPKHSTSFQGQGPESAADIKTEGGALQDTNTDVQRLGCGLAEKDASRGGVMGV